jgi:hypothetical protein
MGVTRAGEEVAAEEAASLPIGGVMTDFIAFEMSAMNVIIPPFACPVSSHAVMPEIRAHDP